MIDRTTLVRYVQECLGHLHDPGYLEFHPLAGFVSSPRTARVASGMLERALVDAIGRMKPIGGDQLTFASVQWRRYRILHLRYEQGLSLLQVANEMNISTRQVSRDQEQAIDSLAGILWALLSPEADAQRGQHPTSGAIRNGTVTGGDEKLAEGYEANTKAEEPLDLKTTVDEVVATVDSLARQHGVTVEAAILDTISAVMIDRVALRQALFSLLSYVIQMAGNSRVSVTAAESTRGVELVIQLRRRAGRPPVARSSESMPQPDTLLTAGRELVEAYGGSFELRHTPVGNATIVLVLPPARSLSVLVVDDSPDIVSLFRRYLRHTGYRLFHAGTGESAMRLATELKPDVITLDLMMPTEDGWDILQRLRENPMTSQIPVVVCSVMPEHALALSLGVRAFVAKPVTRQDLLGALESCLAAPA